MKTEIKDINFTKGDSYSLLIEIDTSITDIINVFFTVKDTNKQVAISKSLNNGITLENNIILLSLKPVDTDDLVSGYKYNYDIQLNYNIDDKLTILKGKFKLDGETTETDNEVV